MTTGMQPLKIRDRIIPHKPDNDPAAGLQQDLCL
jgi:hypothetical protein